MTIPLGTWIQNENDRAHRYADFATTTRRRDADVPRVPRGKKTLPACKKVLHEGLGAWGPSARQIYWGSHIGHMKPSAFDAP
jgi:hypothetical protein